jgi:hypothetical protein
MLYKCDVYRQGKKKYNRVHHIFCNGVILKINSPVYKVENDVIYFDLNDKRVDIVYPWNYDSSEVGKMVEEDIFVEICSISGDSYLVGYYENVPFGFNYYVDEDRENLYRIDRNHKDFSDSYLGLELDDYRITNVRGKVSKQISQSEKDEIVEELDYVLKIFE